MITDEEIINYINEYYYKKLVINIDPFRNCSITDDTIIEEDDDD